MKRRNALRLTASVIGGTIIGSEVFLSGCSNSNKNTGLFSDEDVILMDEVGETILPDSDRSPGAKAAHIGDFMKTIVTDCYDDKEAAIFLFGLKEINADSRKKYSNDFVKISPQDRHELLSEYDIISKNTVENEPVHFFSMMKQLTIWGYFSSESGATKALRYIQTPGRYECIDYNVGDKAWV